MYPDAWADQRHRAGFKSHRFQDVGKEFSSGLTFVACSHVKHISDLLLDPPFAFQCPANLSNNYRIQERQLEDARLQTSHYILFCLGITTPNNHLYLLPSSDELLSYSLSSSNGPPSHSLFSSNGLLSHSLPSFDGLLFHSLSSDGLPSHSLPSSDGLLSLPLMDYPLTPSPPPMDYPLFL